MKDYRMLIFAELKLLNKRLDSLRDKVDRSNERLMQKVDDEIKEVEARIERDISPLRQQRIQIRTIVGGVAILLPILQGVIFYFLS